MNGHLIVPAVVATVMGAVIWILVYQFLRNKGQRAAPRHMAHDDPKPAPQPVPRGNGGTPPWPILPAGPDQGPIRYRPTLEPLPPAPLARPEYLPQLGPPHAVPDIERPDIPPPTGCDVWLPDKGPRGDYCRDPDHQAAGHDAVYSIVNTPEALAPWQPRGLPPEAVEANHGHPDADSSLRSIVMRAIPDDDPEDGDG